MIAEVSIAWARLELSMGLLLAAILDTEAATGVAMYHALTGSAAQDKVLSAAAEAKLSEPEKQKFIDLAIEVRKRAGERNRIVHAMWGVSPKFPDGIINGQVDSFVKALMRYEDTTSAIALQKWRPSDELAKTLMVYKNHDFQAVIERLEAVAKRVGQLSNRILSKNLEKRELAAAQAISPEGGASARQQMH